MRRVTTQLVFWTTCVAIVLFFSLNPTRAAASDTVELSDNLHVYRGPINVGILRSGDTALLFDCGDGTVAESLPDLGINKVDRILFTHHHRDQACGARGFVAKGTKLVVPEAEQAWFDDVETYWNDPKSRWDIYNFHPHRLMLTESVPVAATVKPGDQIQWHGVRITVLDTPGHTDDSVSYLVEVDGRKTVFCGDAIYDVGQIWELYSLQKGYQRGSRRISDYHGFLGAQDALIESLGRIKAAGPDTLVPSHGNVMEEPPKAIDKLLAQLQICYDRYVGISALRHYFPQLFQDFEGRPGHMPIGPDIEVPACLRHYGTSWVIVSNDKAAFVLDAGHERRIDDLKKLIENENLTGVEGLWITHYHNDHVAAVPQFLEAFACPCLADKHVAQVISDPMAWRIPCISPSVAKMEKSLEHGHSWKWHEFTLTSYFLPGQTLYHGGLLVEGHGLRMLFVGDSFTPAGIDDYCALNRNWLGPNVGFNACLDLMQELKPTHLFNCHVNVAFNFTPEQYDSMRKNLAERERLFGDLFPWDHANYGMDESWVRTFPYEQQAKPGDDLALQAVVTNHSPDTKESAARPVLPAAWTTKSSAWTTLSVPAKAETSLTVNIKIPTDAKPGRYVIPIDIRYADRLLPQFTEAIVVVE